LLDCDHQQFDERYADLVNELKMAVQAKWAPARVKAKVLKPMQDALGSKGMTPETILEALYTSPDAMSILNNLRKSYEEQEQKTKDEEPEKPVQTSTYIPNELPTTVLTTHSGNNKEESSHT
jgi:non-homologous end joining protein Ku